MRRQYSDQETDTKQTATKLIGLMAVYYMEILSLLKKQILGILYPL